MNSEDSNHLSPEDFDTYRDLGQDAGDQEAASRHLYSGYPYDIKCIWDSWREPDGSLVMRVNEEPIIYLRVLRWQQGLVWGIHDGWVDRGTVGEVAWKWHRHDHGIELLNSQRLYKNGDVFDYLSGFPTELWRSLERYAMNQWLMLSLAARYSGAADLVKSNPNLLFLLAWSVQHKALTESELEGFLARNQRYILRRLLRRNLGKSDVRLLRKIQITRGDAKCLRAIINLFSTRKKRNLFRHHWPIVPQQVLEPVLERECPVFSRCLGNEIAGLPSAEIHAALFKVLTTWTELGYQAEMLSGFIDVPARIGLLSRYQEMLRLHEWCTEQINRLDMAHLRHMEHRPFPDPPFVGTESIEPIFSIKELHAESQTMQHCVSSFWELAANGDCAYYRVLSPERGTLELSSGDEGWWISEFKLANNQEPSEQSWKGVRGWLETELHKQDENATG